MKTKHLSKTNKITKFFASVIVLMMLTGQLYCLDIEETVDIDECDEIIEDINFETALEKSDVDTISYEEETEKDIDITTGSGVSTEVSSDTGETEEKEELEGKGSDSSSRKIVYHLNGGINNAKNPTEYSKDKKTRLKNPTREGCSFAGWYKNKDFTGSKISSISTNTKGQLDVYAKWKLKKYSISYKLDQKGVKIKSGKKPANLTKYTIEDEINLSNVVPTWKTATINSQDVVFVGWYKDKDRMVAIKSIPKGTTGTVKLYAKWGLQGTSGDIIDKPVDDDKNDNPEYTSYTTKEYRKWSESIIKQINEERKKIGKNELKLDEQLMHAATIRSEEGVHWGSHTRIINGAIVDWKTIADDINLDNNVALVSECGQDYYGSNINAHSNPSSSAVSGWKGSIGHWNDLMSNKGVPGDIIGVGIAYTNSSKDPERKGLHCMTLTAIIGRYKTAEEIAAEKEHEEREKEQDKLRRIRYTIKYDMNGGEGNIPDPITVTLADTGITLPAPDLKKWDANEEEYLKFKSWNSQPNGKGKSFTKGRAYTSAVGNDLNVKNGDVITLYAIYE